MLLPLPEPFQPITHMSDLILINSLKKSGCFFVSCLSKNCCVATRVIEVCLLKGQGQASHIVQWRLYGGNHLPEEPIDRKLAKLNTTLRHSSQIHFGMHLLLFEGAQNPVAKFRRSIRKLQKHKGHQFCSQQFMIGEEMEQPSSLVIILNTRHSGEVRSRPILTQFQPPGPRGNLGSNQRISPILVCNTTWRRT